MKSVSGRCFFDEAKAAQMAGAFLQLRGGRMNYMKLIKLMYLTDREAIIRLGHPITNDSYVSMPHGPVLSATLDLINEGPDAGSSWHQLIERSTDPYAVRLKTKPSFEKLTNDEKALIKEVFDKYGHMNRFRLRDLLHEVLPEWRDPKGSAVRITREDILRAGRLRN